MIEVEIESDIFESVVNNFTYPAFTWIEYSNYLNNTLELGNLTIVEEDDDELYISIDMSNSSKVETDLTRQYEKINISLNDIFDNNFTAGNSVTLNFTIEYSYKGSQYEKYENLTILIESED